jgi:hypothetical protein
MEPTDSKRFNAMVRRFSRAPHTSANTERQEGEIS